MWTLLPVSVLFSLRREVEHPGVLTNYLTKTNYYTNRTMTTQRQ